MNLSDLLVPLLRQALQKPLQKAATWAYCQDDGKTRGQAVAAQNAPLVNAAVNVVAGTLAGDALSQIGGSHLAADKVAGALGIPTTEQGLASAAASVLAGQSTLNVSDQAALAGFLAQNLIK